MMMMQDLHPSLPVSRSGPDDGSGVAPNALRVEYVLVNPVHIACDLLFIYIYKYLIYIYLIYVPRLEAAIQAQPRVTTQRAALEVIGGRTLNKP